MSKASRDKGLRWERRIARELTESTGITHKRVLVETRDGNTGDVRPRPNTIPTVYQAKSGKRPDIYGAVREAQEAATLGEYAIAAIHRTGRGGEKLAVLPWDDWVELVTQIAEMYE